MGRIGKKIDESELRAAYAEHGSIKKLAQIFHTSNNRMTRLLSEFKIKTKSIGNKITLKKKDVYSIVRDYEKNNMIMEEISKKYGINVSKVRTILKENGVQISKWHNHVKRKTTSKIWFIDKICSMLDCLDVPYERNYKVTPRCSVSLKVGDICLDLYKNKDLLDHEGYEYRMRLNRKRDVCEKNGFWFIQIFEDEYCAHPDMVLAKLRHAFGKDISCKKIGGRKCTVAEIGKDEAREFLDTNHIQGFSSSKVYLGARYEGELVAVMTFGDDANRGWCLKRYASKTGYVCQGVCGKMFKYFTMNYKPDSVTSFADRRWTLSHADNLYTKIGFKYECTLKPSYYYCNGSSERLRKEKFRKGVLMKKYGFDDSLSETEMTKKLGFYRIWDCGLFKYVWRSDENE